MSMKTIVFVSALCLISSGLFAQEKPKPITLFTNVEVFDGVSEKRFKSNVLVEGNLIKQISKEPLKKYHNAGIDHFAACNSRSSIQ